MAGDDGALASDVGVVGGRRGAGPGRGEAVREGRARPPSHASGHADSMTPARTCVRPGVARPQHGSPAAAGGPATAGCPCGRARRGPPGGGGRRLRVAGGRLRLGEHGEHDRVVHARAGAAVAGGRRRGPSRPPPRRPDRPRRRAPQPSLSSAKCSSRSAPASRPRRRPSTPSARAGSRLPERRVHHPAGRERVALVGRARLVGRRDHLVGDDDRLVGAAGGGERMAQEHAGTHGRVAEGRHGQADAGGLGEPRARTSSSTACVGVAHAPAHRAAGQVAEQREAVARPARRRPSTRRSSRSQASARTPA